MIIINNSYIKFFLAVSVVCVFFCIYWWHHLENIKIIEIKMYDNMIISLDENDLKSARYFAKKIIKINTKSIYYDISCLFLYNMEKEYVDFSTNRDFKNRIMINNDSLFHGLIEDK